MDCVTLPNHKEAHMKTKLDFIVLNINRPWKSTAPGYLNLLPWLPGGLVNKSVNLIFSEMSLKFFSDELAANFGFSYIILYVWASTCKTLNRLVKYPVNKPGKKAQGLNYLDALGFCLGAH